MTILVPLSFSPTYEDCHQFVIAWMPNLGYDLVLCSEKGDSKLLYFARSKLLPPGEGWGSFAGSTFCRAVGLPKDSIAICNFFVLDECDEYGRKGILYGHGLITKREKFAKLVEKTCVITDPWSQYYCSDPEYIRQIQHAVASLFGANAIRIPTLISELASAVATREPRFASVRGSTPKRPFSRLFSSEVDGDPFLKVAQSHLKSKGAVIVHRQVVSDTRWFLPLLMVLLRTRRDFIASTLSLDPHENLDLGALLTDEHIGISIRRKRLMLLSESKFGNLGPHSIQL